MEYRKIVVYVPLESADAVREAIGRAGGGKIGNYSFCSFSSVGVGRFLPEKGARPAVGSVGKLEQVKEERIEITCKQEVVNDVIVAIKHAHPYEEPVIDLYATELS